MANRNDVERNQEYAKMTYLQENRFSQRGSCQLGGYLIFCPQAKANVRHTTFRMSSGAFKGMSVFEGAKKRGDTGRHKVDQRWNTKGEMFEKQ